MAVNHSLHSHLNLKILWQLAKLESNLILGNPKVLYMDQRFWDPPLLKSSQQAKTTVWTSLTTAPFHINNSLCILSYLIIPSCEATSNRCRVYYMSLTLPFLSSPYHNTVKLNFKEKIGSGVQLHLKGALIIAGDAFGDSCIEQEIRSYELQILSNPNIQLFYDRICSLSCNYAAQNE